jgi:hypothetical protein
MATIEVQVSTSVDVFSADFGGQCHLFPDDQNIHKRKHTDSVSKANWIEGLKLLRWLRELCNRSQP